ncbi:MAG TPA: GNAT family N-acetyltransferase [Gaiellaceae bacterium]|nr:GNAT family N-acetyltransferase [Gaiellaceae bacterium]
MTTVALEPASRWTYAELAEIFNAGYEGYFTPFTLDEAAFRFMSTTVDDDLDASRIALVDGEPAGICKLAIRGERGWIAGIGVSVPHRGQGVGETLMREVIDAARARGLRELWLEVLTPNEPAIRLYEKLGFRIVRQLEVWTLESLVFRKHKVSPVPLERAQARISRERREREPWQRADETVANYDDVEALESDLGAVLFRRSGERVWLLQGVAADEAAARELLQRLPEEATALQWLNGPEGDPFNAAIASLGGTRSWRQHEMVLEL